MTIHQIAVIQTTEDPSANPEDIRQERKERKPSIELDIPLPLRPPPLPRRFPPHHHPPQVNIELKVEIEEVKMGRLENHQENTTTRQNINIKRDLELIEERTKVQVTMVIIDMATIGRIIRSTRGGGGWIVMIRIGHRRGKRGNIDM